MVRLPFSTTANPKRMHITAEYKGENLKGEKKRRKIRQSLQRLGFTSVEDGVEVWNGGPLDPYGLQPCLHPVRPTTVAVEGKVGRLEEHPLVGAATSLSPRGPSPEAPAGTLLCRSVKGSGGEREAPASSRLC